MREPLACLHDATLRGIHVDWEAGTCRLEFAGAPSIGAPFSLRLGGVRHIDAPRHAPWGPSASVLQARSSGTTVRIEMQSGDSIVIDAPGGHELIEDPSA